MRELELRRHSMRVGQGQHLSQEGVDLARRVGATMGRFDRVVTSALPRAFETAIAMGFAVDEQLEALGAMSADVSREADWQRGCAEIQRAARLGGATAGYVREQGQLLRRTRGGAAGRRARAGRLPRRHPGGARGRRSAGLRLGYLDCGGGLLRGHPPPPRRRALRGGRAAARLVRLIRPMSRPASPRRARGRRRRSRARSGHRNPQGMNAPAPGTYPGGEPDRGSSRAASSPTCSPTGHQEAPSAGVRRGLLDLEPMVGFEPTACCLRKSRAPSRSVPQRPPPSGSTSRRSPSVPQIPPDSRRVMGSSQWGVRLATALAWCSVGPAPAPSVIGWRCAPAAAPRSLEARRPVPPGDLCKGRASGGKGRGRVRGWAGGAGGGARRARHGYALLHHARGDLGVRAEAQLTEYLLHVVPNRALGDNQSGHRSSTGCRRIGRSGSGGRRLGRRPLDR